MKSEEEQAQAIANIAERHRQCVVAGDSPSTYELERCYGDREDLLKIVHSQAQKISEQAKEIEIVKTQCEAYKRQANPHNTWETTDSGGPHA